MKQRHLSAVCVSLLCLLAVLLIATPQPAWAQQATAGVTGTITDPSGAPIANASVTAKDTARGTNWPTSTNGEGVYNLPRLPIGSYELRVEVQGFQTALRSAFNLELNQVARIDIQMRVGQISETVEVTATEPLLQTETTTLGTVIESRTMTDLPLTSRNYAQLTLLAPGAATPNPSGFTNGVTTGLGPQGNSAARPYINGNHEQANNFLLDGLDNNQVSDNLMGYTPNSDAIQEFNMITQNASADFGNFQGGIINATIKSGTNQFHGNVFEFFRNDKLNANRWEKNWQGQEKDKLRWNQFGGTFGGPVIKNKLFFFADYQGQRFHTPASSTAITIFTEAERRGDFSALLNQATPIQLKNPFTGQPFANNQIPDNLINPVAKNLFASKYYPQPLNSNLTRNYVNRESQAINQDQGDIKVDYNVSTNDRLFGRYSKLYADDPTTSSFVLLSNQFTTDNAHSGVADWTHSFGPTIVNEFRAGVNYVMVNNGNTPQVPATFGQDIGIKNANVIGPGLLGLNFNGGFIDTNIGNSVVNSQQMFASTVAQLEDSVVITKGKHTIHTGFQMMRQRINVYYAGNQGNMGSMTFTQQYTGTPEGDFMLGLPTNFGGGSAENGTWGQRSTIFAGFVQDNYRVTSSLTLNLGLRYENHTPWSEVKNRQANFGLFDGKVYLAGQSCPYSSCKGLYNSYNAGLDFQPRIGFAWTPASLGGKTVVRGAYTISSYLEGTGTNLRLTMNPPIRQPNFAVSYQPVGGAPPPNQTTTDQGLIAPPPGDPFQGAQLRLWDPNVMPAAVQQWNFSIQQQFSNSTTLQVSYVGQHGTHLMEPMLYSETILNADGSKSPGPYLAGNPELKNKIGLVTGTASAGSQRYDALQTVLQKRYSNGLQAQVAYTFSKCMTDNGGYYGTWGSTQGWFGPTYWQNLYDKKSEWGACFYDQTHSLTSYALYEIPFGKGRRYGKASHAVVNAVAGGWNISAILTAHTGFPGTPYTWAETAGVGLTNVFPYRANCVSKSHTVNRPFDQGGILWFTPEAYQTPAENTFGNCGNGILRGPGLKNLDMSLMKDFLFTEDKKLQFRADFVNFTNTPQLNFPNLGLGPTLGQITGTQSPRNIQFSLKFSF